MAEVDLIIGLLIFIVVICLFATIFGLLYASGLFHHVEIGTGKPPIGQVVIAYKFMKGPYKDCGQLFTEVCSRIKPEQKSLGIYYDDPKVVSLHIGACQTCLCNLRPCHTSQRSNTCVMK